MQFRSTIIRGMEACAHFAELNPFVWKLAWETVHRLPFLLPHDNSYRAFRHFIAARPDGLFLDIGANDGISALSFRKFSKSYRILSLEPNPSLEPSLKRLKTRDPHFDYKIVGASSAPERTRFFVPIYKTIALHTFTSANRDQVVNTVANTFGPSIANKIAIKEFDGQNIRVDDLNVNPTIVKIDAEGFDFAVLRGLSQTFQRARPFIVLEATSTHYEQIVSYFAERNYALFAYDIFADCFYSDLSSWHNAVTGMSGHRNFFAIPDEMTNKMPLRDSVNAASTSSYL